jgi:hypothetical protein
MWRLAGLKAAWGGIKGATGYCLGSARGASTCALIAGGVALTATGVGAIGGGGLITAGAASVATSATVAADAFALASAAHSARTGDYKGVVLSIGSVGRVSGTVANTLERALTPLVGREVARGTGELEALGVRARKSVARGEGESAAAWGTRVHTRWETLARAKFGGRIRTEVSYKGGREVAFGTKGSIRVDGILYDKRGNPIAIYDLKTGNATLSNARIKRLKKALPKDLKELPIIQIGGRKKIPRRR